MNSNYYSRAIDRLKHSRLRRGLAIAIVTLVASCGGGGGGGSQPAPPAPPPPPPPPPSSGLDARPSNASCVAPERPTGSSTLGTQRAFPNLRFNNQPIRMVQVKGDSSRWFVAERLGTVRVFANTESVSTTSLVIDLTAKVDATCAECGLLGMALHPDFPADPRIYLFYTTLDRPMRGPNSRLSEFTSRDGGLTLDPASERVLFEIQKESVHHHAGKIEFGADGFLYISTGDGNSYRNDNGQRLTTLLGKILRIDIRGTAGSRLYTIPADNPFAASTAQCQVTGDGGAQNCPEIYAWGFRNPFSWSFDRQTGDLWVGDVGESTWEEVSRVKLGGNYGWRCFEGAHDNSTNPAFPPNTACAAKKDLQLPIAEFSHEVGHAVTGGYVYRGKANPGLVGRYIFADFSTGRLWDIPNDTQPTRQMTTSEGLETGFYISSFAEDNDGELYITNIYRDIHRVTGSTGTGPAGPATKLSATGCVDAADAKKPASGLIPYTPNAPFWSDGAVKDRWIGLPDGQNITVNPDGDWDFPNGTVLKKDFRLADRLVETRLFMRHPDGVWAGYSYEWNAEQTDATLVRGGKQVKIGDQTWIYPSEGQCLMCHNEAAGRSLGLETKQLAFNITYPQTGRDAHQLLTLNTINTMATPIANPTDQVPYPNPTGTAGTLGERARSNLHTNCSQCHRPNGPTPVDMDLRYSTALADTKTCDVAPGNGDLGIANARIIAPGAADRSVLISRMSRRDAHGMPPVGSAKVDEAGAALLTEWVNSLTGCN